MIKSFTIEEWKISTIKVKALDQQRFFISSDNDSSKLSLLYNVSNKIYQYLTDKYSVVARNL